MERLELTSEHITSLPISRSDMRVYSYMKIYRHMKPKINVQPTHI